MRRSLPFLVVAALVCGLSVAPRSLVSRVSTTNDFVHFESAHVHPLAMTPSGQRLLVVNTPDNRLSVFDLTQAVPALIAEIPVGIEPVSVAALSDNEAWVVNTSRRRQHVTLNTRTYAPRRGRWPSDVVFAGAASPGPGPLAYVSVSQEDAVGLPPGTRGAGRHHPTPAGCRGAGAHRGSVARLRRCLPRQPHLGASAAEVGNDAPPPNPPLKPGLPPPPQVGLIVQQQNGVWRDETGVTDWNFRAGYSLYDVDVAQINTATQAVADTFSDIGSTNLGLAVSPSGKVAVTALAARNLKRFEPNLRGHIVDTRAAVITPGGSVTPIELNPTSTMTSPGPAST
jgi:YVTN family beta-propeller protein